MCASYRFEITVVRLSENFKALMDENVVYKKIGQAIKRNTQAHPEKSIEAIFQPDE